MNVLRVVSVAIGLAWIFTALAKVVDPEPGYELVATLTGGGGAALAGIFVAIAAEAGLGAAMVLGLVRGFAASLALIGALSAAAWWVSEHTGPWVRCGCLGGDGTVDDALTRNVWIATLLAALVLVDVVVCRRAARR